jgi:hypothetical protein
MRAQGEIVHVALEISIVAGQDVVNMLAKALPQLEYAGN